MKYDKEVLEAYCQEILRKILNEEIHPENKRHFQIGHKIGMRYGIGLGICLGFLTAVIIGYVF